MFETKDLSQNHLTSHFDYAMMNFDEDKIKGRWFAEYTLVSGKNVYLAS